MLPRISVAMAMAQIHDPAFLTIQGNRDALQMLNT